MPVKKSTSPATRCGGSGLGLVKLNGTSPSHLQQPRECMDTWRTECYVQASQHILSSPTEPICIQILIEFWLNQISYDSDTQSILDQVQVHNCNCLWSSIIILVVIRIISVPLRSTADWSETCSRMFISSQMVLRCSPSLFRMVTFLRPLIG